MNSYENIFNNIIFLLFSIFLIKTLTFFIDKYKYQNNFKIFFQKCGILSFRIRSRIHTILEHPIRIRIL
jgi:hypothetical protein